MISVGIFHFLMSVPVFAGTPVTIESRVSLYAAKLEGLRLCARELRGLIQQVDAEIAALPDQFAELEFKELVRRGENGPAWLATSTSLKHKVVTVNGTFTGFAVELEASDGQLPLSGEMVLVRLGGGEPVRIPYEQVTSIKVLQDAGRATMDPKYAEWPIFRATLRPGYPIDVLDRRALAVDPLLSFGGGDVAVLTFDRESGVHETHVMNLFELSLFAGSNLGRFEVLEVRRRP